MWSPLISKCCTCSILKIDIYAFGVKNSSKTCRERPFFYLYARNEVKWKFPCSHFQVVSLGAIWCRHLGNVWTAVFISHLMLKTTRHWTIWCCEIHLSPAGSTVTPAQQLLISADDSRDASLCSPFCIKSLFVVIFSTSLSCITWHESDFIVSLVFLHLATSLQDVKH